MNDTTKYWKKYLLAQTDWTQLADIDLTAEEKEAWASYRQLLRNLDSNTPLFSLPWPVPPNKTIFADSLLLTGDPAIYITLNIK